jgi:hypothetical protein
MPNAEGAKGVEEVHILWISEGMSCDGDTVSITAATQPSIEDIVLGVIPGIPKVHLHNKVLAYETGEEFVAAFRAAARGNLQKENGIVSAPVGDLAEGAKATARRSTGINPEARDPIDPRMPNLPPP